VKGELERFEFGETDLRSDMFLDLKPISLLELGDSSFSLVGLYLDCLGLGDWILPLLRGDFIYCF